MRLTGATCSNKAVLLCGILSREQDKTLKCDHSSDTLYKMKPTTLSIQMTTSGGNEGKVNPVDILLSINLLNTDTEGYRKSPY